MSLGKVNKKSDKGRLSRIRNFSAHFRQATIHLERTRKKFFVFVRRKWYRDKMEAQLECAK